MKTLNGHFDGKHIVLDDPVELKPNTREAWLKLSEVSLLKTWNNPGDDVFNELFSK